MVSERWLLRLLPVASNMSVKRNSSWDFPLFSDQLTLVNVFFFLIFILYWRSRTAFRETLFRMLKQISFKISQSPWENHTQQLKIFLFLSLLFFAYDSYTYQWLSSWHSQTCTQCTLIISAPCYAPLSPSILLILFFFPTTPFFLVVNSPWPL